MTVHESPVGGQSIRLTARGQRNSCEPAKLSGKSLSRGLACKYSLTFMESIWPVIAPFPTILSAYYLTRVIPTEQVQFCARISQCPYANRRHSLFTLSDGVDVCGTVLLFCPVFPAGISCTRPDCITWCKNVRMQTQESSQTALPSNNRHPGLAHGSYTWFEPTFNNPCLRSVWNLLFALIKTVKYCPQLWLYDTQTRCCDIKSGHHFSCSAKARVFLCDISGKGRVIVARG